MLKNIIKNLIPWLNVSEKIYKIYTKGNKAWKKERKLLAYYYFYKIFKKYGCYISPRAEIGRNLMIPHPIGIVIGSEARIGDNCTIYQNVTIGRKHNDIAENPTIGNNVTIYCNSTLIGNIKIGDNSIIGCNTVVLKSVEENSRCVGIVK